MRYVLILRAYAPFDLFGLAFKGDGSKRGPTTSAKVSSRIKAWVGFDPGEGTVGEPNAKSDRSHWFFGGEGDVAFPKARVDAVKLGKGWMHFRFSAAGKNPLLPSADIDFRVTMTVSTMAQHLNVNADLTGDKFPNCEVIVAYEHGSRRMVQTYETSSGKHAGPYYRLPGERFGEMNAICLSLPIDASGAFV